MAASRCTQHRQLAGKGVAEVGGDEALGEAVGIPDRSERRDFLADSATDNGTLDDLLAVLLAAASSVDVLLQIALAEVAETLAAEVSLEVLDVDLIESTGAGRFVLVVTRSYGSRRAAR